MLRPLRAGMIALVSAGLLLSGAAASQAAPESGRIRYTVEVRNTDALKNISWNGVALLIGPTIRPNTRAGWDLPVGEPVHRLTFRDSNGSKVEIAQGQHELAAEDDERFAEEHLVVS